MEDAIHRRHIPSFGNWEYCDDSPITQYFESASQGGCSAEDAAMPEDTSTELIWTTLEKQLRQLKQAVREDGSPPPQPRRTRQAKVFDCELAAAQESIRQHRAAKAVDEDLYKIPPELLYRKQRKPVVCDFLSRCLGLNCIV
ncbi:unnamed protein product [Spirodela intermedia]|uniref:Uncharacterized protein n=1 Tax=Spirodela intermedia TaxID=51605 RepID=A0A7I8IPY1_SPIIN|nr:unnamed protein product [Spirodela intermedia]CAA6659842.1 unnamed protein product [Spirodela intermedia]